MVFAPNKKRIEKALRFEEYDIPYLEFLIDPRNIKNILNCKERIRSDALPPKKNVELAKKMGMDAIGLQFNYTYGQVRRER